MPVVRRPAADPRRAHRRPAAASELHQNVAAASSPAAQPPGRDAAESAIADEAWSEREQCGGQRTRRRGKGYLRGSIVSSSAQQSSQQQNAR